METIKHAQDSNKCEKIWYLNYASGTKWILHPPIYIAYRVKKHLNSYLKDLDKNIINNNVIINETLKISNINLGTIIIDFAEKNFIKQIYLINFPANLSVLNNSNLS